MRNVTAIIIACLNRNFLFLLKPFRIFYDFVPSKIQNPSVLKQIFLIELNKISMNLLILLGSAHFLLTLLQYLAKNQRSFVVYILWRKLKPFIIMIQGEVSTKGYYVSHLCQFWQCAIESLLTPPLCLYKAVREWRNIILKRDLTNVNLKIRCATTCECLVYTQSRER